MTVHEYAVMLERALRDCPDFVAAGLGIEPPDSEDEPDNFGISDQDGLQVIVRVERW